MNKFLPILALLLATPIFAAEQATQVEVIARYEGLNSAYGFVDKPLDPESKPQTSLAMPKATTKSDRKFIVRVVREFPVTTDIEDLKQLGMSLAVKPTIEGDSIKAIGKSTICALSSPEGKTSHQLSSFITLNTYFNDTFPNNQEVAIKLSDEIPGTLYLTFTLMDKEGKPVK